MLGVSINWFSVNELVHIGGSGRSYIVFTILSFVRNIYSASISELAILDSLIHIILKKMIVSFLDHFFFK